MTVWVATLAPLVVVVPLLVAGLLLMLSHALPRPIPDILALITASSTLCLCVLLIDHTRAGPLVY